MRSRKWQAVILAAVIGLSAVACGGSGGPSVAGCTKDILAHPSGTDPKLWPHCKGLSQAQLLKATAAAMEQGARG